MLITQSDTCIKSIQLRQIDINQLLILFYYLYRPYGCSDLLQKQCVRYLDKRIKPS
mgnify:FL=1